MNAILRNGACVFGLFAVVWANGEALAQETGGVWSLDARLRYEAVTQEGLENADALTLRARAGYETAAFHGFRGLIELEGVADVAGDYNDTVNGNTAFAIIADPEAFELNRLQLAWAGEDGQRATIGRQRIVLGNARFLGNVGFRQNEQTFDAVRLDGRVGEHVNLTYLYLDRVRRIFGDDSPQGEWRSDSHALAAETQTPIGKVGAYGLLLDFQNAPAQSSQTYGLRWSREWNWGGFTPRLALEGARQSDYRGNSAPFDVGYHVAEVSARRGPVSATVGLEQLDGDGVRGFSTPLATLHVFQGWADVFLNTPPDGVRDAYLGVSYTTDPWPNQAPATFTLMAHEFSSDNGRTDFGDEINASVRFVLNEHVAVEFKAASFNGEDVRFPDRSKLWAALEFRY
jgi:hypothetical protein